MGWINDREAYILANTYGFNPPQIISPSRARILDPGKYEPDHNEGAEERFMVLAHWRGNTNILVKYTSSELEP